jgi:lambda family phage portal protein
VSPFAAIITRLDDIKDYEESERVAAKVAASMAAMIVKGTPDFYDPDKTADPREIKFTPGMVFDDLMPGESVEVIDSKRPNPNVETYRNGQLRAAAAGLGVSYSSMAKHYDGTYSAQRQELVEQWVHYAVVAQAFTAQFVRPVWERFVGVAITAGLLDIPADLDPQTLDDALYIGQAMPWIDPKKEAEALEKQEQAGYMSGPEIIRRRGANPREVLEQEAAWRKRLRDRGVVVTADPANEIPAAAAPAATDPMDNA